MVLGFPSPLGVMSFLTNNYLMPHTANCEFPSPLGIMSFLTHINRYKMAHSMFPSPLGVMSFLTMSYEPTVWKTGDMFPSPLGVMSFLTGNR